MSERRLRQMEVAPNFLADLFGNGTRAVEADEPVPDLVIEDVKYDRWADKLTFLVSSESFEAVPDGGAIPDWNPSYRSLPAASEVMQEGEGGQ